MLVPLPRPPRPSRFSTAALMLPHCWDGSGRKTHGAGRNTHIHYLHALFKQDNIFTASRSCTLGYTFRPAQATHPSYFFLKGTEEV